MFCIAQGHKTSYETLPNITQFAEHWEFARCCDIMSKVCLYNMRIYDM